MGPGPDINNGQWNKKSWWEREVFIWWHLKNTKVVVESLFHIKISIKWFKQTGYMVIKTKIINDDVEVSLEERYNGEDGCWSRSHTDVDDASFLLTIFLK